MRPDIEKKLNRGRLGGGWGDGDEGRKAAEVFARDAKARRGELKTDFDPDKVDLEEVKSYCKSFPVYLRKSATIIPVLNVARSDKSVGPVSPKPHRCRSCRGPGAERC